MQERRIKPVKCHLRVYHPDVHQASPPAQDRLMRYTAVCQVAGLILSDKKQYIFVIFFPENMYAQF